MSNAAAVISLASLDDITSDPEISSQHCDGASLAFCQKKLASETIYIETCEYTQRFQPPFCYTSDLDKVWSQLNKQARVRVSLRRVSCGQRGCA